jgi:ABC-type dipeptide/oligopeptide/nickel transport system permease component
MPPNGLRALRSAVLFSLRLALVAVLAYVCGALYAGLARNVQAADSPGRALGDPAIGEPALALLRAALGGDFGRLPGQFGDVATAVITALGNSVLVLVLAFVVSTVAGIGLAFAATRPGDGGRGFALLSAVALSLPPFFVAIGLSALIIAASWSYPPVQSHWLLPVVALSIRSTLQIARLVNGLIAEEYGRQYVLAARGVGNAWDAVRRRHIWPNIVAPAILHIAATFRQLVAELVLIEWLLNWPGLGRLLATALIVPKRSDAFAPLFLSAPLLAALFAVLAVLFVSAEAVARFAATLSDPRLRAAVQTGRAQPTS